MVLPNFETAIELKEAAVFICTVILEDIYAILYPSEWKVYIPNDDVGLVDIGFVKTEDILAIKTVPASALEEKGLVNVTIYELFPNSTVQSVDI